MAETPGHVSRLRVGGGQAADRQRRDRLLAQVRAQQILVPPAARTGGVCAEVPQHPVVGVEVEPVDMVVDDTELSSALRPRRSAGEGPHR